MKKPKKEQEKGHGGRLDGALRPCSRLQLLLNARHERLDTRTRALMGALRGTAANMLRLLRVAFRPIRGIDRNAAALTVPAQGHTRVNACSFVVLTALPDEI